MTRVLLAGLSHETHCFVDGTTGLADFSVARGAEVLAFRGNGSTIDGFLEVAASRGWEVVPACAYAAMPSATVEDAVFDAFWRDLRQAAEAAPFDAVFLSLHGAMVCRSRPDSEGALLETLRRLPGLGEVPVFGVFDLHANMTPAMAAHADGLVCYRENPHIDARDSAARVAGLLARALDEGVRPRMVARRAGVVWPPTGTGTADSPMRELAATARRLEAETPEFWAVNVIAGFSFADVPDAGVAFSIVTTGDAAGAGAALHQLCRQAWTLRRAGLPIEHDPADALARIMREPPRGPALLVEPADNVAGGAPGNGTGVLRALLAAGAEGAGVVINDPEAVAALATVTPGRHATLAIGGKDNRFDPGPVTLDVELLSTSDGNFTVEDIRSHLVAVSGRRVAMGPCAVVRHAGVVLLLTSRKTPPFDLGQWRSQGIEPAALSVIGVKAAVAHRRAYDGIAAASFTVATPGPCSSDPRTLPYTRLRRPIYPLDEHADAATGVA